MMLSNLSLFTCVMDWKKQPDYFLVLKKIAKLVSLITRVLTINLKITLLDTELSGIWQDFSPTVILATGR